MKSSFEINAFTATIGKTERSNSIHIINNGAWVIPIYQRPYSWKEKEISRFLRDLIDNFKDESGNSNPMFIGTMQVSENKDGRRQVIDGQQRLSTFLLLFKVLNTLTEDKQRILPTDFLKTKVNRGEAQQALESAMLKTNEELTAISMVNNYAASLLIIEAFMEEQLSLEDHAEFVDYLLTQVYFVCIETTANLSKTLQIFESINATGMDLNAGDLFKVNFYEYLRINHNAPESIFDEISELYAKIDRANAAQGEHVTDINDILTLYKMVLISKYDMPNALYFLGTETFYDQFFDKVLNNVKNEGFTDRIDVVELSIADLDKLIDQRIGWHTAIGETLEEDMAYYFIIWSRYNRYWRTILTFQFAYQAKLSSEHISSYKIQMAKLLFIYSVKFGKAVNECHGFVRRILKAMFAESDPQKIIDMINEEIGRHKSSDLKKGWFELRVNEPIAEIARSKYLLCRLGAMLSEDYLTAEIENIKKLRGILCFSDIDIEHIASYNHEDESLRQSIWEEWGAEINSLGNLVVLERNTNRAIKNAPYKVKKESYKDSQFTVVKNINTVNNSWTLEDAKKRRESESGKILKYIFQ
jgi:hypothetical protein